MRARSKEIEAAGLNGADPFKEVRIQSVVVEFLLSNVEVLFSDSFTSVGRFTAGTFNQNHQIVAPCFYFHEASKKNVLNVMGFAHFLNRLSVVYF